MADATEESIAGVGPTVGMAGKGRLRRALPWLWLAVVFAALYFYFFRRAVVEDQLRTVFSLSAGVVAVLYVVLNAVRPFTLIPPTFLLFAAMPFVRPLPLFLLTLVGIAVSSSVFYWFSETLNLAERFERRHQKQVEQIRSLLRRHELPIIIGWSFFLIMPTDLLCYVCGTLRINFPKFLIGVLIGEGSVFAIYIFFGNYVMGVLPFGP